MITPLLKNSEDELDCVDAAKPSKTCGTQSPAESKMNPFNHQPQITVPPIIITYSDKPPNSEHGDAIIDSPDIAAIHRNTSILHNKHSALLKQLSGIVGSAKSENKSAPDNPGKLFFTMGIAHSSDHIHTREWKDASTQRSQMKTPPKDKVAPTEVGDGLLSNNNQSKCKVLGIIGPNIIEMAQVERRDMDNLKMDTKKTLPNMNMDTIGNRDMPVKVGCCSFKKSDCCRIM